jgi:hypothetical protein
MQNHLDLNTLTENIFTKLLDKFKGKNAGKPTPEDISTISAKLKYGQPTNISYGDALNQYNDPQNIISQLANLRNQQPELFTPEINNLIKNEKYKEALTKINNNK